jgi:hypothetical protein
MGRDIRQRLTEVLCDALRGNWPLADHITDILLTLPDITITEGPTT